MRDNLKRLVEYASNPEKTEYGSLAKTLHYAENDAKTVLSESVQLVSGIHPNFPKIQPTRIKIARNKAKTRKKIAKRLEKGNILA